jgi:hypothetical protein
MKYAKKSPQYQCYMIAFQKQAFFEGIKFPIFPLAKEAKMA